MKLFVPLLLAALGGLASISSFAADPMPMAATEKAPVRSAKADIANGEVVFNGKSCAACHNADGNSAIPANPKLAQQHPEYLVKQLQEFKSGKRKSPVMAGMAAMLSDQEMRDVALVPRLQARQARVCEGERPRRPGREDLPWRHWGPQRAGLRGLPQSQRRRHPEPVPAAWRTTRRVHRRAADIVSRWDTTQQRADEWRCSEAQRSRNQGGVRLHRRPALSLDQRAA